MEGSSRNIVIAPESLDALAAMVLRKARDRDVKIVTCESCTGGLVASLLTDVEGLSHVFERGLVAYSNQAKAELLDVPESFIRDHGAVSAPVAEVMAKGALERSDAQIAIAVTGFAGPAGPDDEIGLVFVACADERHTKVSELHLGDTGRTAIRNRAAHAALLQLMEAMTL